MSLTTEDLRELIATELDGLPPAERMPVDVLGAARRAGERTVRRRRLAAGSLLGVAAVGGSVLAAAWPGGSAGRSLPSGEASYAAVPRALGDGPGGHEWGTPVTDAEWAEAIRGTVAAGLPVGEVRVRGGGRYPELVAGDLSITFGVSGLVPGSADSYDCDMFVTTAVGSASSGEGRGEAASGEGQGLASDRATLTATGPVGKGDGGTCESVQAGRWRVTAYDADSSGTDGYASLVLADAGLEATLNLFTTGPVGLTDTELLALGQSQAFLDLARLGVDFEATRESDGSYGVMDSDGSVETGEVPDPVWLTSGRSGG